jgi:hypothetical protein
MPASELFPHEPTIFGDIVFSLMMLSTAAIIFHVPYSIIKRRKPLPKLLYKLLIPNFIFMLFSMFLSSAAQPTTHFLTCWWELHIMGFCCGITILYGFLNFFPGIEYDIFYQPPRKRGVGRLMFPKLHRLMRRLRR